MAGSRHMAPIDFNNVDTRRLVVPALSADPSVLKVGNIWLNTASHLIKARTDTSTTTTLSSGNLVTKFAATIGDGSATSYAVTHSLGTADIFVQAYVISTGVNSSNVTSVTRTSTNVVTLVFGSAPASNTVRVVVLAA